MSLNRKINRLYLRSAVLCSAIFLLSGCSILDIVNTLSTDRGSSLEAGIAYGELPRQKFDIYRPDTNIKRPALIVFFYGGSWVSGTRQEYEFVARKLAAQGHFVVVPDYRLYPEVVFPGFINDAAMATSYIFENIGSITGQSSLPIFVMGHSAGAQIAATLAVDQRALQQASSQEHKLAGFIGLSGPYDFLPLTSDQLRRIFPDQKSRYDSQAVNFVDSDDPPALLIHGELDQIVLPANSISLSNKLAALNVDTTLKIYPGLGHVDVLKPFIDILSADTPVLAEVERFIDRFGLQADISADPIREPDN